MNDPWKLIESGDYRGAITACSRAIQDEPSVPDYNNRATAHLLLRDYDRALADFAVAGCLDLNLCVSDSSYNKVAGVLWLKRAYEQAADLWLYTVKQMLKGRFTHTDLAGGVKCGCLLWFAAARLSESDMRDVAEAFLEKKLVKFTAKYWPGPIAAYLVGKISPDDLYAAVTSTPILRERQLCQAEFYVGARALSEQDLSAAAAAFKQAASQGAFIEMEHFLAEHEAHRLSDPPRGK